MEKKPDPKEEENKRITSPTPKNPSSNKGGQTRQRAEEITENDGAPPAKNPHTKEKSRGTNTRTRKHQRGEKEGEVQKKKEKAVWAGKRHAPHE